MGRRPKLKSDEFSVFTPLLIEISRCEHFFTAEKVLHLFGALPPATEQSHSHSRQGARADTRAEAAATQVQPRTGGAGAPLAAALRRVRETVVALFADALKNPLRAVHTQAVEMRCA